MNEPRSNVEQVRQVRFNSIWLVPLIAVLVASWMLYENWSNQGQLITLIATNAEGLVSGKTTLKARNVDVGKVINIRLSDDYDRAIITVRMNQGTERMLLDDAQFWVVKPRIGKEGVSGLSTLLSGAYIEMIPGEIGRLTDGFPMLSQPPLSAKNDGIRVILNSNDGAKLDIGTLVHFRGYEVGYIEEVGFDLQGGTIKYRVVIQAPYDALVTSAVQFWITPGVSFKSSASGFEVQLDSLDTFLSGGITFDTAEGRAIGKSVGDMAQFRLFTSQENAANNLYDQFIDYVFLFDTNISGLIKGAAVEFRGVRIGTVLDVPFKGIPMKTLASIDPPLIPVRARIEPQRLYPETTSDEESLQEWNDLLSRRIEKGLRASLVVGNYLNAAKVISLDFMENPSPIKWDTFDGYRIFPTAPNALANIEAKVGVILDNLADVSFKDTFNNLGTTVTEVNETLNQLQAMGSSVQKLLETSAVQQLPTDIAEVMNELNKTLTTYQANGQIGRPLRENMIALERALNELQPLFRQLREKPNTLIFDRSPQTEVLPKAAK